MITLLGYLCINHRIELIELRCTISLLLLTTKKSQSWTSFFCSLLSSHFCHIACSAMSTERHKYVCSTRILFVPQLLCFRAGYSLVPILKQVPNKFLMSYLKIYKPCLSANGVCLVVITWLRNFSHVIDVKFETQAAIQNFKSKIGNYFI